MARNKASVSRFLQLLVALECTMEETLRHCSNNSMTLVTTVPTVFEYSQSPYLLPFHRYIERKRVSVGLVLSGLHPSN